MEKGVEGGGGWKEGGGHTIIANIDHGDSGVACCCDVGCVEDDFGEGDGRDPLEGVDCGHFLGSGSFGEFVGTLVWREIKRKVEKGKEAM